MTAWVRRTDPKPGSRNWRHRAVCTPCQWAGYRFENVDSAEKQATKHNEEKHSMAEMKPQKTDLKVTLYARIGDSEVLNEIAVVEREFEIIPITNENRAPGDAPEATMRLVDTTGFMRMVAAAARAGRVDPA